MSNTAETQDGSEPALGAGIAPAFSAVNPLANTFAAEAATFPIAKWDRYTFVRMLGQGGMGAVYEARDNRLNRHVALKFIRGGDPRLTMRLAREARAQARIEHENVCKVFEVGEVEGKAYISMQFVQGDTLDKAAARMSLDEKVIVIRDGAMALHAAHTLGILHRDIKPSNILVEVAEDGRRKPIVMDFGLARDEVESRGMTETGTILGTPAYMSPEQARGGRDVDRRSDVYRLGATLYELVCGDAPFTGDTPMNIVLAVLHDEPIPLRTRVPSIPVDLATIAAKCLHKDPGQRYESARALAEDLDRHIRGKPILGRRESAYRRIRRWGAKHRALVVTALLAFVALGFAGGIAVNGRIQATREKAELQAQAEIERELGQDIKEMEWLLRTAHMLPLHDVTRERTMVKERMTRIEARASAGGRIGALADYAMGRGHLVLGEDEEAYNHLTREQKGGIDSPELHYALGLVQGRRYQNAMNRLRGGGDTHWIEQQTKEIEAAYQQPALVSIEKSRGVWLEAPSYLEALIAFYKKDYSTTLELTEKAREEASWFYEAIALQAYTHFSRGMAHKYRGEWEQATRDFDHAARLYDEAAEIGRSDESLYQGSAEARSSKMWLNMMAGLSSENELANVIDRVNRAARVRPDRGASYTLLSNAYVFQAWYLQSRGLDPRQHASSACKAAERARALDGDTFAVHEQLAACHGTQGIYELEHGMDPRSSIALSFESSEKATQIDPRHPWGWIALGVNLREHGRYVVTIGGDPTDYFVKSIASSQKAAEVEDDVGHGLANSLFVYSFWAQWLTSRGVDLIPKMAPVADFFDRCMQANPKAQCQENEAIVDYYLAEYQLAAGQDPTATMRRSEANLEIASTFLKDYIENREFFAAIRLLQAQYAFTRGADTSSALAAFDTSLADCLRLNAQDPMCKLLDARRFLLVADIEALHHHSEKASLEKAITIGSIVIGLNLRDADIYQVVAEAQRRLASMGAGLDQAKHLKAGRVACEKGLAINPNHPRLLLVCGGLGVLEARSQTGQTRVETIKKATETLEKAATLNPLLRRDVDAFVAEAKRLGLGVELVPSDSSEEMHESLDTRRVFR